MPEHISDTSDDGSRTATLARATIAALQQESPAEYRQLIEAYSGSSAVIGVFGMGSCTITVSGGGAQVNPPPGKSDARLIGRAFTYPETLVAMANGRVTPLEAFHAGDLIVRASTDDLHKAYDLVVHLSGVILRSKGLQNVLRAFEGQPRGA